MKGQKTFLGVVVLIAALALTAMTVFSADVPQLINYQGRLTDSGGGALDTTVAMTFTIYDAATGGNTKWTETQTSVTVIDGLFNVLLGSSNAISDTVFNNNTRYLGITVGSDPEISPRTRLVSVGYAMQAQKADTAEYAINASGVGGWTDNGSTVDLTTTSDVVVVGPTTPTTPSLKFDIRGHGGAASPLLRLYFNTTFPSDLTYPAMEIYNPFYDYTPLQIVGAGAIIQNSPSKGTKANVAVNRIDPNPANYTFFNAGNVGIGTTEPQSTLEVAGTVHSTSGGFRFPDGTEQITASTPGIEVPTEPFFGSTIIDGETQKIIAEWIGRPSDQWTLCYKMSSDGPSSSAFHTGCDNMGPTVTLVFTATGYIVGGYTETSWNQSAGYLTSVGSMIFSITNNRVYPLAGGYEGNAINSNTATGPIFGLADLYIDLSSAQVRSAIPNAYSASGAHSSPNSTETNMLLGASVNTTVPIADVEVYIIDRPY